MTDDIKIHIDASEKRGDLPEYDQMAPCPQCGSATETGFGLAGGGYGVYFVLLAVRHRHEQVCGR